MSNVDPAAILRNVAVRREEWECNRLPFDRKMEQLDLLGKAFEWVRTFESEHFSHESEQDSEGLGFLSGLAGRFILLGRILVETGYAQRLGEIPVGSDGPLAYTLAVVRKACEVGDVQADAEVAKELISLIVAGKAEPELRGFNGVFLCELRDRLLERAQVISWPGSLPPIPQGTEPTDRIRVDDSTRTVYLDGAPHPIKNAITYRLYAELVGAHLKHETPLPRPDLAERARLRGDDPRPNRYFDKHLPAPLRATIDSQDGPNGGYSLKLPRQPSRP